MKVNIRITGLCIALFFVANIFAAEEATLRLRVQADFQNRRMEIVSVDPNGPAANLSNNETPLASLEQGDVIESIDGLRITNRDDLVLALNRSVDGELRLSVKNVQNGQVADWWTSAEPTGRDQYSIARDACLRAIRSKSVPDPGFSITISENAVSSTVSTTLAPIRKMTTSSESLQYLMIGLISIRDNETARKIISDDVFERCDSKLSSYYEQFLSTNDRQTQDSVANDAVKDIQSIIKGAITEWASRSNRKVFEKATVTELTQFRVQSEVAGASVQLMAVADKVITLSRLGNESIGRPSENGLVALNQSERWTTLPIENARAYGTYYYRFINGASQEPLNEFSQIRKITITPTVPVNGAITFRIQ